MEIIKKIYLLGVGRNTPVFIDLAEHCGYEVAGLYHYNDDKTGEMEHDFKIIGSFDDLYKRENLNNMNFLLTMGDNAIRTAVAQKLRNKGGQVPALVHPTAIISRFAKIEEGVCISAFSYVQADSSIGQDTIILSGVNISHNNIIGKGCFIAGGATVGAYTTVSDFVFIGQGVLTISSKVKNIGEGAYIGAGSLITKSIVSSDIVAGRPAKSIKNKILSDITEK